MMYPVFAKVKYGELGKLRGQGRLFGVSFLQTRLIELVYAALWVGRRYYRGDATVPA